MVATPRERPSLKREADDSDPLTAPPSPPPSTKRVKLEPVQDPSFLSRAGPIEDDETWGRNTSIYNHILQSRTTIIKARVAAAAALEYNTADLVTNVKVVKDHLMDAIKNAMVWNEAFEKGQESRWRADFSCKVDPGMKQVLRVLFPGIGTPSEKGKEKGWNLNGYTPAEFRDIMGTDMIGRVGTSFAELSGAVVVVGCIMKEGRLQLAGTYRELRKYPVLSFPKTREKRR